MFPIGARGLVLLFFFYLLCLLCVSPVKFVGSKREIICMHSAHLDRVYYSMLYAIHVWVCEYLHTDAATAEEKKYRVIDLSPRY